MSRAPLTALKEVINYFGTVTRDDFPAQQLTIFLHIAIHERKTIHEIHQELKMPQGSVSRNIQKLSRYRERRSGEILGYNLLHTERDLEYPNRVAVTLTPLGKEVRDKLIQIMEEGIRE